MAQRPRVVIVGAGFGGLWAARYLGRSPVDVVLVDRNNYHTFFPLLYQVAAAELEPEDVAYPIRSIVRKYRNVRFTMGEVTRVDTVARVVETEDQSIPYDYLILATGSSTNYFGVAGAAEHSFPLRTLDDGIALRNQVLLSFEKAVHEPDVERRRRLLTCAIVGGGPTGVEFVGALSELVHGPLRKDYKTLDVQDVRVILVEATENLLPSLPERLRDYALRRVKKLHVDVYLNSVVDKVTPDAVHLKDSTVIPTETVVWTAGVYGGDHAQLWGLPVARNGMVSLLPTLQVVDHDNVYAIGDLAYMEEKGRPLPKIATVGIQQGTAAARNILRQVRGEDTQPFRYRDSGTLAVIGRNAAVAHLFGRWAFTGFLAWVFWLVVHLLKLIGFRNRLVVLTSWAWDYLFFERVVRLILPSKQRRP